MPQIANQDFSVIRPDYADCVDSDYIARSILLQHILRGTIFDCIIENPGPDMPGQYRPVSFVPDDNSGNIFVYGTEKYEIYIPCSFNLHGVRQLAVQGKIEKQVPGKQFEFLSDWGQKYLVAIYDSDKTCWVVINGKCVEITKTEEDEIATAKLSNFVPTVGDATAEIEENDLSALVGISLY